MTMPVFLFAAGAAVFARRTVATRPPQLAPLQPSGQRPPRTIAIWATFAAISAGLAVQIRIAGDVLGLSTAPCILWVSLSLAVLLVFLRGEDRRSVQFDRAREVGGLMCLCAAALTQGSAAILAISGGATGAFSAAAAIAMQVPLCALAAGVLSRQRHAHAAAGGSAKSYLGGAFGGAGVGLAFCLPAGWSPGGRAAMAAVVFAAMAWGACREIFLSKRHGELIGWAAVASAVLVATTAGLVLAAIEAGDSAGAIGLEHGSARSPLSREQARVPPHPAGPRRLDCCPSRCPPAARP
jgi:hypothetical protein